MQLWKLEKELLVGDWIEHVPNYYHAGMSTPLSKIIKNTGKSYTYQRYYPKDDYRKEIMDRDVKAALANNSICDNHQIPFIEDRFEPRGDPITKRVSKKGYSTVVYTESDMVYEIESQGMNEYRLMTS